MTTATKTRRPVRRNYDKMPANRNGIEYFYHNLVAWGVSLSVDGGKLVFMRQAATCRRRLRSKFDGAGRR